MLRRTLLALGSVTLAGGSITAVGQEVAPVPGRREEAGPSPAYEVFHALFSEFTRGPLDPAINVVNSRTHGLAEIEQLNRWSENLMETHRRRGGPLGRTAIQSHVDRMRSVEEAAREKLKSGQVGGAGVAAASYYRQAAEALLAAQGAG